MRLRTFHPQHPFGKINVTPMIDVVMCLIVFYLIVGKLAADQRATIRLPASSTGVEEKTQDTLIINVMPTQEEAPARFVIDTLDISPDNLQAAIRDRLVDKQDVVVELRGSRELTYSAIAFAMRACKEAGVESVRLATERIELPRGGSGGGP
jgi:biopolymer transport protein ExbD